MGCAVVAKPSTSAPLERWVAQATASLPSTIAADDVRWADAPPAYFALHDGSHGPLTNEVAELRALYDQRRIAFRARWNGPALKQETPLFSLLWRKDDLPGQRGLDCHTACHLALGDDNGQLRAVVASVVPKGREEPMPSDARWRDGMWTLAWSRPLRTDEALDIQFSDLSLRYPVRAKVTRGLADAPDWLSERYALIFSR